MNLIQIAFRNLRYRFLASVLTIASLALGIALCVLVLSIGGVLNRSLERNSNVGYNLIVGAKGAATQLVFSTAFYIDNPIQTIPWDYYMEFLSAEQRREMIREISGEDPGEVSAGRYAFMIGDGFAIPVCLGDFIGRFRLVATTPDFFEKLRYGDAADREYRFAVGRNFVEYHPEHRYFEAVVGSQVAEEMNLNIGDSIYAAHSAAGGDPHEQGFTVVGILEPSGTPNDRAAFGNIEGFFLLDGHVKPNRDEETGIEKMMTEEELAEIQQSERLPIDRRELTAVLVRHGPFGSGLARAIDKTSQAQAVSPIQVITELLELFVRPVQRLLLLLTILVCIVSAISILVSIYNSMKERTGDIAVMRALGASRDQVMLIIFGESLLITLFGTVFGLLIGKGVAAALSPYMENYTGVRASALAINWPYEPYVVGAMMLVGVSAGLIPAITAYRTDVAQNL